MSQTSGRISASSPGAPLDDAEIVVIGAGPAGSVAAATLAARGYEVLIIDKDAFPREKPCGDGLTRSSVAFLERFGLSDLVQRSQHVEGARLVLDHGREEHKWYRDSPGRCVPRLELDQALLDAALSAGARLLTARAVRPLVEDAAVTGIVVDMRGREAWISGRHFVAADGPNSRMRHQLKIARSPSEVSGYAVRQYFDVERPVAPLFDVYTPLITNETGLVGYGWVFPISEHRANIGVGFHRVKGIPQPPPIRTVLNEFVAELSTLQSDRFGRLSPLGDQFGSPLGMNFSPDSCQWGNVLFVGDAARMTDPLTGEGIATAMLGGEELGEYLHEHLRASAATTRGADRPGTAEPRIPLGERLGRFSPRLGQDIAMPVRVSARIMAEDLDAVRRALTDDDLPLSAGQPYLDFCKRMLADSDVEAAVGRLPGIPYGARLTALLDDLDRRVNNDLRSTFPFVTEVVLRRLHERGGPVRANALFMSMMACGGDPGEPEVTLAVVCELLDVFPELFATAVDRPGSRRDKLNNALAIVNADYVLTRALKMVSTLGAGMTARVARVVGILCEAAMSESGGGDEVLRTPESYLAAASARSTTLTAFACRAGAELTGRDRKTAAALETYGRNLGMAFRVVADLQDLLDHDSDLLDSDPGALEVVPSAGVRNVAAMLTLAGSEGFRDTLAAHDGPIRRAELVRLVRSAKGVELAAARCGSHVEAAKRAMAGLPDIVPGPLDDLADIPLRQCADLCAAAGRDTAADEGARAMSGSR